MGRKRKVALTLLPVVMIVALGAVAWQTSDLGRASRDLEAQRAAAKREGVPTEYADLRRLSPPVGIADNAAVPYARAFEALRSSGALKGLKADRLIREIGEGKAKPEDLLALRGALEKAAPALEMAREGARRPGFSFDRQWEKGAELLFPEYADARGVVRALVLRAMLTKTPGEAGKDLRAAARMRAQIGSEPVLIAALVGNSLESDIHRGIRALGWRGDAWNAAVAPALDDLGPIPPLRRSLSSEAVWGTHFTEELEKYGPETFTAMGTGDAGTPVAFRLSRFGPMRDAYQSRVFEFWRKAWANLPQDPTDFRAASAALQMPPANSGPSYAMLEFLMPVFDQFAQTNTRAEANRRLTRAALELWRSGEVSALPKDPFGSGPLHFRKQGHDWTIWSVGPDGKNDGGKPESEAGRGGYDLVIRYDA